ncbi:MAG: hypothetical protein QW429_05515 [Thermoprotei archaeon]
MGNRSNKARGKVEKQLVRNIGFYYVCYELSKKRWNVILTSSSVRGVNPVKHITNYTSSFDARNMRGVDIVIYKTGSKFHSIKVKTLSKRDPVPFGENLDNLLAEYIFIVNNVEESPNLYIMDTPTVRSRIHTGINDEGKLSYWLDPKAYEEFKDKWEIIGET